MVRPHPAAQADLFGEDGPGKDVVGPPPADFIARIRRELLATLAQVEGAERLPWSDLTKAFLAELRFDSIAGWLPPEEAGSLRARFEAEIGRLYAALDSPP